MNIVSFRYLPFENVTIFVSLFFLHHSSLYFKFKLFKIMDIYTVRINGSYEIKENYDISISFCSNRMSKRWTDFKVYVTWSGLNWLEWLWSVFVPFFFIRFMHELCICMYMCRILIWHFIKIHFYWFSCCIVIMKA